MAVYTNQDLTLIEQAIEKLHKGERVKSVIYGDHHVHYADMSLNDLLTLRQRVKSELASEKRCAKRRLILATSKGCDAWL